jgi:signal transduction histidine kinase
VVANLVGNAVRYSPGGGRIGLRARRNDGVALVEVRDPGVGFDGAVAAQLFEPFLQLRPATARTGGLGLGLYLARELVARMGGRIWAESEGPGRGATFAFTLPLHT